jgi:CRISPR-associated endonuclease Cas1 subtype I-F
LRGSGLYREHGNTFLYLGSAGVCRPGISYPLARLREEFIVEAFKPSELKTILHSKRANIYYLEKCRVMQKDGRVLYLTEAKDENLYWNIPIANTTVILLGIGTSITQAAVRMLVSAGVLIGFSGSGGTPLLAGNEIEWLTPQSEYRPTEYVQGWVSFWFDEAKRLKVAKTFGCRSIRTTKITKKPLVIKALMSAVA